MDCNKAGKYLNAYLELSSTLDENNPQYSVIAESLLSSAIVSYGKAFTRNRGGENSANFVEANLNHAFRDADLKIQLHKVIVKKRNKIGAHSDSEFINTDLIGRYTIKSTMRKVTRTNISDGLDVELFKEIACDMFRYFNHRAYDLDIENETVTYYEEE